MGLFVGGVNNRWEHIIYGKCLDELKFLDKVVNPGDIVISSSVREYIKDENNEFDCAKIDAKRKGRSDVRYGKQLIRRKTDESDR